MSTADQASAFILGGNADSIAITSSFADENAIVIALVPVALTPMGATFGDHWQRVSIPADSLLEWIERTLISDDERSFVTQLRDIDLLTRIAWQAPIPELLDEKSALNPEDLPEELFEALVTPAACVVQCASCRRLCVSGEFVWKDKQLCAWDYHSLVFGKRGPWRNGEYEERHFSTLTACHYVAPPLLEELGVDIVLQIMGVPDELGFDVINRILAASPDDAHLAVRTHVGFVVLRERER